METVDSNCQIFDFSMLLVVYNCVNFDSKFFLEHRIKHVFKNRLNKVHQNLIHVNYKISFKIFLRILRKNSNFRFQKNRALIDFCCNFNQIMTVVRKINFIQKKWKIPQKKIKNFRIRLWSLIILPLPKTKKSVKIFKKNRRFLNLEIFFSN